MKDLKIFTDQVEQAALDSINNLLAQPAFAHAKVRIMPDVHAGKGCVIGFTADLGDKVIPNVVGVDIGCGMLALKLDEREYFDFSALDKIMHEIVPTGFNIWNTPKFYFDKLAQLKCYEHINQHNNRYFERSIGTLGSGNHFVEVDRDSNGYFYLIIHTGSRGLGLKVCQYYQNLAIKQLRNKGRSDEAYAIVEKLKAEGRHNEINLAIKEYMKQFKVIPDNLCYLEGKDREDYLHDMHICQEYAAFNREMIANIIVKNMNLNVLESFHTVHNYIDPSDNIVRKGAIAAKKGVKVLIPINMRDGCILGVGLGNDDWNQSAPHGAGRVMSRAKAKRTLTVKDFEVEMTGIYSSTVNEATLDEAPMAYKKLDDILSRIGDTVKCLDVLKPVYNFKAETDESKDCANHNSKSFKNTEFNKKS